MQDKEKTLESYEYYKTIPVPDLASELKKLRRIAKEKRPDKHARNGDRRKELTLHILMIEQILSELRR